MVVFISIKVINVEGVLSLYHLPYSHSQLLQLEGVLDHSLMSPYILLCLVRLI